MRIPKHLLRQRVKVTRPGENHGDGPGPGTTREVRAQVSWSGRLMRAADGTEVVTAGSFLCDPSEDVREGDDVDVPGDTDGGTRTVFTAQPGYGPNGKTRHLLVTFQ